MEWDLAGGGWKQVFPDEGKLSQESQSQLLLLVCCCREVERPSAGHCRPRETTLLHTHRGFYVYTQEKSVHAQDTVIRERQRFYMHTEASTYTHVYRKKEHPSAGHCSPGETTADV